MKVVFRVDASTRMGTGHVMRCLALAEVLRSRGARARFICRAHAGHLVPLIKSRAFPAVVLPGPVIKDGELGEDYGSWLGATPDTDAAQTIAALNGEKPDWLIVDHYGAGIHWERRLRPHVGHLMVIDDLANRPHDCDVLLDQNLSTAGDERYASLVPAECRLLTGPRYAMLAREYAAHRCTPRPRNDPPQRVLVYFGGSDALNATGLALEALSQDGLRHLEVDVVVGPNNPHRALLHKLAESRPGTTVHGPQRHLAGTMSLADFAIGAGGATTWERMCMGLPAVVVSIADNQKPACKALADASLIYYVGHRTDVDADRLAATLRRVILHPGDLTKIGSRGCEHVDGMGAARVAEILCPSPLNEVRLRAAMCGEPVLYLEETANSDKGDHLTLEAAGLPLGSVRFENHGDETRIGWRLDPVLDGRAWESHIIGRAIDLIHEAAPVTLGRQNERHYFRSDRLSAVSAPSKAAAYSIVILSDRSSWINEHIGPLLLYWLEAGHRVLWVHDRDQLVSGDFCFLLGYGQVVRPDSLAQFRHCLVVHESDLPSGKGWSPLTWQILGGSNRIPVTLLEAAARVDSGTIYAQEWPTFEGHELIDELRLAVGRVSLELCKRFVHEYPQVIERGRPQVGSESFFARRTPANSRLDPTATIESQLNLLRIVDNERYPAFFELHGHRYRVRIEKMAKGEQPPEFIKK